MRRRAFLGSVGGAVTLSLAGCLGGGNPEAIEQTQVDTIEARGSSDGTLSVPIDGQVTVIDMFGTWCAPCKPTLDNMVAARAALDADARFVSVTNEVLNDSFTEQDIAAWWGEHGGEWTVAHDAGSETTRTLDVTNFPTTIVTDADRVETWRHVGIPTIEDLRTEIETAATG